MSAKKYLLPFQVDNTHSSLLVQDFLILLIRLMLPSGKINMTLQNI